MTKSPEQLDEFIRLVQSHGDASSWKKGPADTGLVNIVSILNNIPKADVPKANLLRVRNRVLDKISLPKEAAPEYAGLLALLPRIMRVAGGIVGAFTIMLSLTIGTAVAALESVPGQTIYPVKRMVESVQLTLATNPEAKTNLRIKFANNRVDELAAVLQKQKEGKASDETVQKAVAEAIEDIQQTSAEVADKSKDTPQVGLLTQIVTLSDKQTAVINAAQADDLDTIPDPNLALALEASKTAKEQAVENIERAGLVVETQPLTIVDEIGTDGDVITTEGRITNISRSSFSIGNSLFMVTEETVYDKITFEGLEQNATVKVKSEARDRYTYALRVTLVAPAPQEPAEPTNGDPDSESPEQQVPDQDDDDTVPLVP